MAAYPCLRCDRRFGGKAFNVYLQAFNGDQVESYRFVVCDECRDFLVDDWRVRALYREVDGSWVWHEPTDEPVARLVPSQAQERGWNRKNGSGDGQRVQAVSRPPA